MTADQGTGTHVVIVGAGFGGLGCAKELAGADGVRVTLLDEHNYHQFQPLVRGKPRRPFDYHDKGIMAMIGRGAAVAEVGEHRHELHGSIAFAAWLGVHVELLSGVRQRTDAFVSWAWDYFSKTRGPQVLDRSETARIDRDDDGGSAE